METVKDTIKVSDLVLDEKVCTQSETSLIVPDKCADILKIIEVDSSASILKKNIKDGRISVEGEILVNILYVAEGSNEIVPLSTTFDFNEIFDINAACDNVCILADADVDALDLNLINSRKVSLKAKVCISLHGFNTREIEYIKDLDSSDGVCTNETFKGYTILECKENDISIKEKCDALSIGDILKSDYIIKETESKIVGNKVVVKGAVIVTTLYKTTDNSIKSQTSRFPFTEVFECNELYEDDSVYLKCSIKSANANVSDSITTIKTISYDIIVSVSVVVSRKIECDYVSDAFLFGCVSETTKEEIEISDYQKSEPITSSIHEIIEISSESDEIDSLYNLITKPEIKAISKRDNDYMVSVVLHTNVLYMKSGEVRGIGCKTAEISQDFRIMKSEGEPLIEISSENLSYNLSNGGIEIRGNLILTPVYIEKKRVSLLKDVERKEKDKENELIIFFATGDESIWEISKKYAVNPNDIIELNSLDAEDTIKKGQRIIIPSM